MQKRQYIDIGRRERIPFILADFLIDNYHKIFKKKQKPLPNIAQPNILIFANGHLGDALQISFLFPLIKNKFPKAKINIVAPSWCDVVWKHNSLIDSIIHLDDADINRGKGTRIDKLKTWWKSSQAAIKALKKETFDFVLELRYSNHHFLYLLPFLNAKQSIGYGTRGLGGFLDIELPFPPPPRHNMDWLLQVLKPLGINEKTESITPVFEIPENIRQQALQKVEEWQIGNDFYMILPESGAKEKMFKPEFWVKLITQKANINKESQFLISGLTEHCDEIYAHAHKVLGDRVKNVRSKLSIHEMGVIAEKSKGVFCLDSFPVHLCTIFCPVVAYFQIDHLLFLPINNYPIFIYHHQNPADWKLMNRKGFHNEQVTSFDEKLINETINKI